MNYILIMIVVNSNLINPVPVVTSSTVFSSNQNCMEAISKILEMENKSIKIKARCVKE